MSTSAVRLPSGSTSLRSLLDALPAASREKYWDALCRFLRFELDRPSFEEAAQAALAVTATPAFTSTEVTKKLDPIEAQMRRLIAKPKPKPPKVTPNATSANASDATANGTTTTAEEEPPPTEEKEKEEL